jgi:pimeloyl-ACP methyl ester carboxylesterase
VKNMVRRLQTKYDWRKYEAEINQYPQFTTDIDGQNIHFLHIESAETNATPLLLIHGWPGSIVEFLDVIEPFTNPVAHGGKAEDAFHLVIASIPGFGFSGPTKESGWNNGRVANAFIALMSRLGYEEYGVQGGDAGAIIGPDIGRLAPKSVIGIHVNGATLGFIPMGPVDPKDMAKFSAVEKVRLKRLQRFMAEQGGYNAVQSGRPQALAYGLTDSPVGLLAWNSELYTNFGDTPDAVSPDKILTNFMIYWLTDTAASSIRFYYENAHDPAALAPKINSGVPTAVAVFANGEVPIRKYGEQANTIVRWTEFKVGGHYAVMEVPELVVKDVREFFASLRQE